MDRATTDISVYKTRDFASFKKLLGNRDVTSNRINVIKESILKSGYTNNPILVNEKMEVIDGQGRLAACEDLEIPILFIVQEGLTIDDCINMNKQMERWKDKDYIKCYADRGFGSYVELMKMMVEFPALNWQELFSIGSTTYGANVREDMRNGRLKFEPFAYTQYERARWISAIKPSIGRSGLNTNRAIEVLIRLDKYKLIDRARMLDSVEKYAGNLEFGSKRTKDTVYTLNEIYNFNRKGKKYFADKYVETASKHNKK